MNSSISESLMDQVNQYIEDLFNPLDDVLRGTLEELERAGMPQISVTPSQGKFLYLLVKISGARSILEIGTLAGFSTIWLGRALPEDGRLISLEINPSHAQVARRNLERAGLSGRVTVRIGRALDELQRMQEAAEGPFDLVFIDADKPAYPAYLQAALRLTRPGSLILADNVIRGGDILDPRNPNDAVAETRRFNQALASCPELESTVLLHFKGKLEGMSLSRRT